MKKHWGLIERFVTGFIPQPLSFPIFSFEHDYFDVKFFDILAVAANTRHLVGGLFEWAKLYMRSRLTRSPSLQKIIMMQWPRMSTLFRSVCLDRRVVYYSTQLYRTGWRRDQSRRNGSHLCNYPYTWRV